MNTLAYTIRSPRGIGFEQVLLFVQTGPRAGRGDTGCGIHRFAFHLRPLLGHVTTAVAIRSDHGQVHIAGRLHVIVARIPKPPGNGKDSCNPNSAQKRNNSSALPIRVVDGFPMSAVLCSFGLSLWRRSSSVSRDLMVFEVSLNTLHGLRVLSRPQDWRR